MDLIETKERLGISTDKSGVFLTTYGEIFADIQDSTINLLEVGIHRGESLRLWAEYFSRGKVYGLDLSPPQEDFGPRVKMAAVDQANAEQVSAAIQSWGCELFDVIIDDASHIGHLSAATFSILFEQHLKPGGLYIIEDWGTGYWPDWPDGDLLEGGPDDIRRIKEEVRYPPYDKACKDHHVRSHNAGMAGFVKMLVDLVASSELASMNKGLALSEMIIRPGIVAARKAS